MAKSAPEKTQIPGYVMAQSERSSGVSVQYMFYHFSTSGISVATATAATHPLDMEQLAPTHLSQDQLFQVHTGKLFAQTMQTEGPRALYLGLGPSLTRSVAYGGLRLGLYEPCKYVCDLTFGSTNILVKIASGAFSGAVATALTNPMEVLKVRLQMNASLRRGGAIGEMRRIASNEGANALWKGVGPAMARAAALTASQLATYDESKQALIRWMHLEEGIYLHFMSSAIAGTVGTLVTAPMDMIKTRLMLQHESNGVGRYRNGFHCAYKVTLTEGTKALYKGGLAIFARLGPQTTITFLVCEKLRQLAGMGAI